MAISMEWLRAVSFSVSHEKSSENTQIHDHQMFFLTHCKGLICVQTHSVLDITCMRTFAELKPLKINMML